MTPVFLLSLKLGRTEQGRTGGHAKKRAKPHG